MSKWTVSEAIEAKQRVQRELMEGKRDQEDGEGLIEFFNWIIEGNQ